MNVRGFLVILAAAFIAVDAGKIDHDKVEPFPQPDPVTISEKAAVKFKPQLLIEDGCVSFPAVNAAGETSGGLKGNSGNSACDSAPLGSQVYGRAMWYKDVWAIMYAWYFPKGFFVGVASRRFDWSSAVVWIDNPDFAAPKILGISTSTSDDDYETKTPAPDYAILDGTTTLLFRSTSREAGQPKLYYSSRTGDSQPLIMWEQLPEAARLALNTTDFGLAYVPINDDTFEKKLKKAWPF
ncbi:necrosis inducing-like protein NPP1 type [Phytophthora sojae]|uniref:Necrosis inducing-like protein NPP1 type n=1 Tax=Phytophthora sojae (strain P6497) TaxID=1094619 RepID=G4ZYJ4_PHYSP|nr:necrosis inducing-like protein NPP1 type [Phytophthora sojae]EGZ12027.1 necrosis inducing-like protein NPP1 type [Phytophthora sojae]|eukprot:XP_009532360.1 necrosis inducing-like protein NPP1 type [Phytophthora sojae]